MNSVALFAYGVLVTLVVGFGIGLLVWGAILDGRHDHEVRARLEDHGEATGPAAEPGDHHLGAVS